MGDRRAVVPLRTARSGRGFERLRECVGRAELDKAISAIEHR
jgi:hypothetical protein